MKIQCKLFNFNLKCGIRFNYWKASKHLRNDLGI